MRLKITHNENFTNAIFEIDGKKIDRVISFAITGSATEAAVAKIITLGDGLEEVEKVFYFKDIDIVRKGGNP